jgi:acyl dehydratase
MNNYRLQELDIGMRACFSIQISPGSIDKFQALFGDLNPLHSDLKFANASGYKNRVVHGMLTAGFYSKLIGHYLPGKYALLHRLDTSFIKPVFEGDNFTVSGEVIAINTSVSQIEIKAEIVGKSGRVSRAKIWTGVRE